MTTERQNIVRESIDDLMDALNLSSRELIEVGMYCLVLGLGTSAHTDQAFLATLKMVQEEIERYAKHAWSVKPKVVQ